MPGFTKLQSTIINSSIWDEPDNVRIVWITLLAMSDAAGFVESALSGLAHQCRKSKEDTQAALFVLESPDHDSKNPDHDGRRIKKVEGGWIVLNYVLYRDKPDLSDDPETIATRERVRKYRERKRAERLAVTSPLHTVTSVSPASASSSASASKGKGSGEGEQTYERPPALPKPQVPTDEPISTSSEMAEGRKWAIELIAAYGETPAQAGPSVYNTVLSNCTELVTLGKPRDKFELLVDWLKNSKNAYKPKSPQAASDPANWQKWQTSMQDEIERENTKRRRDGPNI